MATTSPAATPPGGGGSGISGAVTAVANRLHNPCPARSPPAPGDFESESYEHWRRRFHFWLRGEIENATTTPNIVREFTLAIRGPAQDRILDNMTDDELYTPARLAVGTERGPGYFPDWVSGCEAAIANLDQKYRLTGDEMAKAFYNR